MMKQKNIAVKTQQHKAVSIRDLWNRMNNGIPLNVPVRQVFDGDEKSDDFGCDYFDEYADRLELAQFQKDKKEQQYLEQVEKYNEKVAQFKEKAKKAAEALTEFEKMNQDKTKTKGGIHIETPKNEETQN